MVIFDINYPALVYYLLPLRKRRARRISWLNSLIAPLIYLYRLFKTKRADRLYYLAHNSQVVSIRSALNDLFDPTFRRINITDSTPQDPLPVYIRAEQKPLYIYTRSENQAPPLYTRQEIADAINGFIVQVPSSITFNNAQMSALIDQYRLPGKHNYSIVTI